MLLGYARGIIGSRRLERACRENVVFMALSGDSAPHFTTIASFVSTLDEDIAAAHLEHALADRQDVDGMARLAGERRLVREGVAGRERDEFRDGNPARGRYVAGTFLKNPVSDGAQVFDVRATVG